MIADYSTNHSAHYAYYCIAYTERKIQEEKEVISYYQKQQLLAPENKHWETMLAISNLRIAELLDLQQVLRRHIKEQYTAHKEEVSTLVAAPEQAGYVHPTLSGVVRKNCTTKMVEPGSQWRYDNE